MIDLHGKTALVFGVASEESIAWAIAKRLHQAGAGIILGYQHRFRSRLWQLMQKQEIEVIRWDRCDVTSQGELDNFFGTLAESGQTIDILVHSIAFAPFETFNKPIYECTAEEFSQAMQISSHSLAVLSRYALPLMQNGGSIMTMTYHGSTKVAPRYQVMGVAKAALEAFVRELAVALGPKKIRVNAISAGPIRTLAAQAIGEFDQALEYYRAVSPLRENISQEDVANMAAFLASPLAARISGQILYVDAGFSAVGMLNNEMLENVFAAFKSHLDH